MLALYRSGRQADALDTYQAGRRVLQDELGLEPGKELRELQAAILRQDEALSPARPVPAVDPSSRRRRVASREGSRRRGARRPRGGCPGHGSHRRSLEAVGRHAGPGRVGRRRRSRRAPGRRRDLGRVRLLADRRRRRRRLAGRSEREHADRDRPDDEYRRPGRQGISARGFRQGWPPDRDRSG